MTNSHLSLRTAVVPGDGFIGHGPDYNLGSNVVPPPEHCDIRKRNTINNAHLKNNQQVHQKTTSSPQFSDFVYNGVCQSLLHNNNDKPHIQNDRTQLELINKNMNNTMAVGENPLNNAINSTVSSPLHPLSVPLNNSEINYFTNPYMMTGMTAVPQNFFMNNCNSSYSQYENCKQSNHLPLNGGHLLLSSSSTPTTHSSTYSLQSQTMDLLKNNKNGRHHQQQKNQQNRGKAFDLKNAQAIPFIPHHHPGQDFRRNHHTDTATRTAHQASKPQIRQCIPESTDMFKTHSFESNQLEFRISNDKRKHSVTVAATTGETPVTASVTSAGKDSNALVSPPLQNTADNKQQTFEANSNLNGTNIFQISQKPSSELTQQDLRELHRTMEITVQGKLSAGGLLRPIREFNEAPFPQWILDQLYRSGYTNPYPVQSAGWVVATEGRDMIGIAKTGSGKTLAYLLPALIHIQKQPTHQFGQGPIVLVLAPTRELALQIEREAHRYTKMVRLQVVCIYGGVPKSRQAAALRRGVHICIGTPGRLIDFLETNMTNLQHVTYLVLDEADRMLDMGFEPQLRRIVSQIRPERQTLMWSATWPKCIQHLAREFCKSDPIRITVGSHELQANEQIRQIVEVCTQQERLPRLLYYLQTHIQTSQLYDTLKKKALVFCETKKGCDLLHAQLRNQAIELGGIASIHGDKDQLERDRALSEFKYGRCNVLIATDVASRGLDIKGVGLVVNYDIPKTVEGYIHRIGRTGRAGADGTAITLFSDTVEPPERARLAREFCAVIRDVGQIPPLELEELGRSTAGYYKNNSRYPFNNSRKMTNYNNRPNTPAYNVNINHKTERNIYANVRSRPNFPCMKETAFTSPNNHNDTNDSRIYSAPLQHHQGNQTRNLTSNNDRYHHPIEKHQNIPKPQNWQKMDPLHATSVPSPKFQNKKVPSLYNRNFDENKQHNFGNRNNNRFQNECGRNNEHNKMAPIAASHSSFLY